MYSPNRAILWLHLDSPRHLRIRSQDLFDKTKRIGTNARHDVKKFDNVEPAFSAFIFCDERLRLLEARGEILLRQSGALSRRDHQIAERVLLRRVNRFGKFARARSHGAGKIILLSDYPKSGYRPNDLGRSGRLA